MTHVYFVDERKLHFRPTKTYVNKIMFHADRPTKVRSKKKGEGGIETAVANERKCLYGSHKDGQIHHVKTFFLNPPYCALETRFCPQRTD